VFFQAEALWGSLTVTENLTHQLRSLTDLSEDALRERALERLRDVGLAAHCAALISDSASRS
jgi:ABC-type transporter Mla maintaining outer membrane lipid asymmetry ATPase subunit MlaF